jgi:hypothetical protein
MSEGYHLRSSLLSRDALELSEYCTSQKYHENTSARIMMMLKTPCYILILLNYLILFSRCKSFQYLLSQRRGEPQLRACAWLTRKPTGLFSFHIFIPLPIQVPYKVLYQLSHLWHSILRRYSFCTQLRGRSRRSWLCTKPLKITPFSDSQYARARFQVLNLYE